MKFVLVSPRLAIQKGDFLGSGIPYWPIELATLASHIRNEGDEVALIDLFGADPCNLSDKGEHYMQGIPLSSGRWKEDLDGAEIFVLYAISYMSHQELLELTQFLKEQHPEKRIAILENSQAVTAYSLPCMAKDFFDAGADCLICGEPYSNWDEIKQYLQSPDLNISVPENIIFRNSIAKPIRKTEPIDRYPIPAWDLIEIQNYWKLPYSHGPKTKKFLPILTSRGCPYPCDFCVVPETNNRRWRGNKPEHVVDEIIRLRDNYGVHDFQVEDLNPTVQRVRWERICELLIERKARIRFYFVSGTKAETIRLDQIALYAEAGCRYISISPESGSIRLMKSIGKKFDQPHGVSLVKSCSKHGIRTQACFLVGHPDETTDDFVVTKKYLAELVKAGLDEVAIFIVSPFAGSRLFANNIITIENKTALLSFSPKGRVNYKLLELRRRELILTFFIKKLQKGLNLWLQGYRAMVGIPQTKMENLPLRIAFVLWVIVKHKLTKIGFF